MMGDFERKEAEKRNAERSKNNLEAYIISTGSVLEDGAFDEVSLAALPLNATANGALIKCTNCVMTCAVLQQAYMRGDSGRYMHQAWLPLRGTSQVAWAA